MERTLLNQDCGQMVQSSYEEPFGNYHMQTLFHCMYIIVELGLHLNQFNSTTEKEVKWNKTLNTSNASIEDFKYFNWRLKPPFLLNEDILKINSGPSEKLVVVGQSPDFYASRMVWSVVEYACVVWHNLISSEECTNIECVQKTALRIILKSGAW